MHFKVLSAILALLLLPATGSMARGYLEGSVTWKPPSQADRVLETEEVLDMAYDVLDRQLDPPARRKLAAAQKAWERFKVAECDFKANHSAEQPLHPVGHDECLMALNLDRAGDLQSEAQWRLMLNPAGD